MPAGRERRSARSHSASPALSPVIAIFHHTCTDVDRDLAVLRRHDRYRLLCRSQMVAFARRFTRDPAIILWQLSPGRRPNWRRLRSLAPGVPVASYSTDRHTTVLERSRELGFTTHLQAPLQSVEVAHQVALAAPVDLATRWRDSGHSLTRFLHRVDVMSELTRQVAAPIEPIPVADALVGRAAAWLPAPGWVVVGPDRAGAPSVLATWQVAAELKTALVALGGQVMRAGRCHGVRDLSDDRRYGSARPVAAIAIPLACRGDTVGALVGVDTVTSERAPVVSSRLTEVLRLLLEPAAMALDNAIRMQRAQALTVTDDLTKLFNSRYLFEVLRREGKRAVRSKQPLSVLFLDLDGFKAVNDTYGHLYGSRALVEAGAVIRNCARETDVVARFGGDEFAVVLPDTDSAGAMVVAARLCERIASYEFLREEGCQLNLTASTGVATLPDDVSVVDHLLQAADTAMYWVKAHGKDGIQRAGAVA
ncbi:MAG: diguanylate cyclase [Acidobacteriota bacterium]|nr:diguanylate cyclase [Acidobacteriota bacterium]